MEIQKVHKVKSKKSFREKLKYFKDNITIEPILATRVIPSAISRLATSNLNLEKACRVNLAYGAEICNAVIAREGNQYKKEELAVQELVASMEVWKNIVITAVPSLLILFLGAWSDRTGKRKICILLPILGELLTVISNIVNTYYFYELPVQITMFFEAFFPSITGGWVATFMGAFSYISDISSPESRTFRVGIANFCMTCGMPVGEALSGLLLNCVGYYGVFGLSSLLYCVSLTYGMIYIKDVERPMEEKNIHKKDGVGRFLKDFFDFKHVKDTLLVAFKKGPNNRRTKSILVLVSIVFVYGAGHGEFTVRYLFTRYKFNWDALMYSFYTTSFICVHSVGAIISISLFSRYLGWDDSVLGLISNVTHIVGALLSGLARNSLEMYLAVLVEVFNATSFTALRSISSKLVNSDELGKMTAIFNLTEILTSMVSGASYSWIYKVTIFFNPSFFYFVSVALEIPAVIIFIWFFKQHTNAKVIALKDSQTEDHGNLYELVPLSDAIVEKVIQ